MKNIILTSLIALVTLGFGVVVGNTQKEKSASNKEAVYEIIGAGTSGLAYKLNRVTGEVWMMDPNGGAAGIKQIPVPFEK